MDAVTGFLLFLGLTLAALGVVVVSGFRARRNVHIPAVVCAVVLLLVTIYYAEQLGTQYDLETAGAIYPVHLFFAKVTTPAYLLPIVTGIRTLKKPAGLRWHKRMAFLILLLTVVTAATGTAMVFMADPIAG